MNYYNLQSPKLHLQFSFILFQQTHIHIYMYNSRRYELSVYISLISFQKDFQMYQMQSFIIIRFPW